MDHFEKARRFLKTVRILDGLGPWCLRISKTMASINLLFTLWPFRIVSRISKAENSSRRTRACIQAIVPLIDSTRILLNAQLSTVTDSMLVTMA